MQTAAKGDTRPVSRRSFFLREDPLLTSSSDRHLTLRGIEFEKYDGIDLELVFCRRLQRDSGLPGRLKVKRRSISGEGHFCGSPRDGVNAGVAIQNLRADIEPIKGGDLKR